MDPAEQAEKKKISEIEQCFYLNDFPKQGKISNEKLVKLMRSLGTNASEEELPDIYKKIDASGSGYFGLEAFKGLMIERIQSAGSQEELKAAFELFDRNSDGVLTLDDLEKCANFLKVFIQKNDLKFMFEKADGDGDGKITFEDFCNLLS